MTGSTGRHSQNMPAHGAPIILRQYLNWRRLIGATVQIRQLGQIIRTGTVDDAMADSTTIWVSGDATQPRTMYEAAHGIEVWTERNEAKDWLGYHMTHHTISQLSHHGDP